MDSNEACDSETYKSGGYRISTLGKLNSKSCLSATASSNTITNEDATKTLDQPDSQAYPITSQWSQKETVKLKKNIQPNNKKGSSSSLNETSSDAKVNTESTYKKTHKQQDKSNIISAVHSNKGLRNFFGKLIRTSLVNINESNFTLNNETAVKQPVTQIEDSKKHLSMSIAKNNNNNIFRRGGTRATASARLENSLSISNNSLLNQNCNEKVTRSFFSFNLDTLAFSKLNSVQCYDWLCKNGFDCYFSKMPDGNYSNKWLKNGLHLLKASKYEYEKVKSCLWA